MLEDLKGRPERGCRGKCFACCAWTCAALSIALMIVLIVGLVSLALLRSSVPKIMLASFTIPKLKLELSSSRQRLLTADFNMTFEVYNKNDNVALKIRPLTVDVSSENINIGRGKTRGFSLQAGKLYLMNAYARTVKQKIGDSYTEQFLVNIQKRQVLVDIVMHGKLVIKYGVMRLNGLPMRVKCKGIYQSVFDSQDGPKCDVRLFSFD